MVAKFREVTPYSGVDENLTADTAGMIVALKGSNLVKLVDGADLDVVCSDKSRSLVLLDEITDKHQIALANVVNSTPGPFRLFKVTARGVPGMDKVAVEAFAKGTSKLAQAKLKVLVLRPMEVTISLRPAQIYRAASKGYVNFTELPFDPKQLLDEMNLIWTPQANVIFKLGKTDSAPLKALAEGARVADIDDSATLTELTKLKDGSNFTAFFVRRAFHGKQVLGVTDEKAGVALIGDDRSDRTLAHEAGHYLGSHNDSGAFTGTYGHPGVDMDLMREGGAGWRIPYSSVPYFNRGYTSKP